MHNIKNSKLSLNIFEKTMKIVKDQNSKNEMNTKLYHSKQIIYKFKKLSREFKNKVLPLTV